MSWWRQERHGPDYMGRLYAMERALKTDEIKPVVVIGGGAAGIVAAVAAARQGAKVTLLERKKAKCRELPANCSGVFKLQSVLSDNAPDLAKSVLEQFGVIESADFLESLGIETTCGEGGILSKEVDYNDIHSALTDELERLQAEVVSGCTAVEIVREKGHCWTVVTAKDDLWIEFKANALVMATGLGEGYRSNDGTGPYILKKIGVLPPSTLTAPVISYKTLGLTEVNNIDLYLAGELVKPEGWNNLSNLHWALATGNIAGKSAANAANRIRETHYD